MIPTPLTWAALLAQEETTPINTAEHRTLHRLIRLLRNIEDNNEMLERSIADCQQDLARASALLAGNFRVPDPRLNVSGLLESINRRQVGFDQIAAMCYILDWDVDEILALQLTER